MTIKILDALFPGTCIYPYGLKATYNYHKQFIIALKLNETQNN